MELLRRFKQDSYELGFRQDWFACFDFPGNTASGDDVCFLARETDCVTRHYEALRLEVQRLVGGKRLDWFM